MDPVGRFSISAHALYARLGTAQSPLLLDVRSAPTFDADRVMIVGALRRPPDTLEQWAPALPRGKAIVVYCGDGLEISAAIAARLNAAGHDVRYLEGGMGAWLGAGLAQRFRRPETKAWVTRERPKIDRIACPWLVRRFIDPDAQFLYVPVAEVRDVASQAGAIPYDIGGAEFGHVGEHCSFDAFLRIYGIRDPVLDHLALIVRGADTGRLELTPQSPGLLALSHGLSANYADDHAMLEHGMILYDALYAWCRNQEHAATEPSSV